MFLWLDQLDTGRLHKVHRLTDCHLSHILLLPCAWLGHKHCQTSLELWPFSPCPEAGRYAHVYNQQRIAQKFAPQYRLLTPYCSWNKLSLCPAQRTVPADIEAANPLNSCPLAYREGLRQSQTDGSSDLA